MVIMFGRAFASESVSIHSAMMQKVRSPVLMMLACLRPGQSASTFLLAPGLHSKPHGVEHSHGYGFPFSNGLTIMHDNAES